MESGLLSVRSLHIFYESSKLGWGSVVQGFEALKGVSLDIEDGQTLGIVGESGSGKTTLGRAIVRLVEVASGEIFFDGIDILKLSKKDFLPYRKKIQMIFQDPFDSLNPRMTIEQILMEPIKIHFPKLSKVEQKKRIIDLLDRVRLPVSVLGRCSDEFSGGQRQRIGIARALAVEPKLVICDEPVSALDVSIQAEIINLLKDLQKELRLTYLFISHDMAVVHHISHRVAVMQSGKIIEEASADDIYKNPQNPYTWKLLQAIPEL